jgi:CTP:molybdopterin cytidylyltransferase MocA
LRGSECKNIAIVLAAGRGVRMRGPKALMMVQGREWWRVQRERLHTIGVSDVWVVSPDVLEAMKGQEDAPERTMLSDADAPMFASIVTGVVSLREHPPRGVFLLPVDVPAPAPSVWKALGGGESPCIPRWDDRRGHPVWLPWKFVEREILPRARDREWVMQTRLDRLLAGSTLEIDVDDQGVLTNLNTPDEVAAWARGQNRSHPRPA